MIPILAIGPHIFASLPLSIQKIEETTRSSWPAQNRFGVGPARQYTGRGEDSFKIEGLFFHEEFGGMSDYLALKATQAEGKPVSLIGWSAVSFAAQIFGEVVILEVSATHEYIGMDGVGRKVVFSVELAPFGGNGDFGGLFG
jgi:uncharacterized protein